MDFYKYHALGNDYIVIDPQKTYLDLNPHNISLICNRNYGIGSDGILFGPMFDDEKIYLRIYNPDGSEAETSGNGIRIFARYLINANYIVENAFSVNTVAGESKIEVLNDDATLIKVDMGSVSFSSPDIPVSGDPREVVNEIIDLNGSKVKVICLSIGNPHCVIPLESITPQIVKEMGPMVETHALFPNRINVQLLEIIDRKKIKIEIWERGVGYTLASGSSSCAAAAAAYKIGLVDRCVTVEMPGGIIDVEIDENYNIHLIGAVSSIAEGFFTYEMWKKIASP
ncbi:MAG: diaminopimelate epimerase [Spirochaetes bacterium]|jgi:diaminopimelate epimerase|nr:diaminopimelate epimerase [Spirochaetota bacterium]